MEIHRHGGVSESAMPAAPSEPKGSLTRTPGQSVEAKDGSRYITDIDSGTTRRVTAKVRVKKARKAEKRARRQND